MIGRGAISVPRRQSACGQVLPFGIAAGISRERPFASTAEVAMTLDALRRHQAARRSVSSSRVRRSGAFLLGPGFGALVEQALGIARPVQGEWRAGAVTQQPPAPPAVGVMKLLTWPHSRHRVEIGCGLPATTAYELT